MAKKKSACTVPVPSTRHDPTQGQSEDHRLMSMSHLAPPSPSTFSASALRRESAHPGRTTTTGVANRSCSSSGATLDLGCMTGAQRTELTSLLHLSFRELDAENGDHNLRSFRTRRRLDGERRADGGGDGLHSSSGKRAHFSRRENAGVRCHDGEVAWTRLILGGTQKNAHETYSISSKAT